MRTRPPGAGPKGGDVDRDQPARRRGAEPHRADALPPGMAPRKEGEEEKRKPRYRETDHVRAFYQTNRY